MNWPELLKQLSAPFPASAVRWRAGRISKDKKRARAVAYAASREYEDRLNLLCGGDWSVSFKPWGKRIICELTIHGVTRSSTGESDGSIAPGTSAEAQAFKRACSKFGLGRYLYDIDAPWVAYDDERECLLETPRLAPQFLPKGVETSVEEGARQEPAGVLGTERAQAMHRELYKLGIKPGEQYRLASTVLGNEVKDFASLSEEQAAQVWNEARRTVTEKA